MICYSCCKRVFTLEISSFTYSRLHRSSLTICILTNRMSRLHWNLYWFHMNRSMSRPHVNIIFFFKRLINELHLRHMLNSLCSLYVTYRCTSSRFPTTVSELLTITFTNRSNTLIMSMYVVIAYSLKSFWLKSKVTVREISSSVRLIWEILLCHDIWIRNNSNSRLTVEHIINWHFLEGASLMSRKCWMVILHRYLLWVMVVFTVINLFWILKLLGLLMISRLFLVAVNLFYVVVQLQLVLINLFYIFRQ
jgi:hypothetical protein